MCYRRTIRYRTDLVEGVGELHLVELSVVGQNVSQTQSSDLIVYWPTHRHTHTMFPAYVRVRVPVCIVGVYVCIITSVVVPRT